MTLEVDGENVARSAPSTSNCLGHALDREREPFSTRGDLQATPNPTHPQNKSPQTFPCHRPQGLGRGRGWKREEAEKLTETQQKWNID